MVHIGSYINICTGLFSLNSQVNEPLMKKKIWPWMVVCKYFDSGKSTFYIWYIVEPPNKGQVGDNINSAVVSFVERLSSSWRFKMYWDYKEANFWDLDLCPL